MALSYASRPLAQSTASARVDYLQKVLLWTTGGLVLSGITGMLSASVLYLSMAAGSGFLMNRWVSLAVIFGSYGVAQYVAPKLVFGESKLLGFALGAGFQGIAMGYLLLAAVMIGMQSGSPFGLVGTAMGLTGLTGVGLTAYVWSKPREFKMLGALLSAMFLPMLVIMGVSFVFPSLFGGPMGIAISGLFVLISAAGLLYQVNAVLHRLRTDQHIEGAYMITMGLLILFWNILSLLTRLNRR